MRTNSWADAPTWAKHQARNFRPTVDCIYWVDDEGYMVFGTDKKFKYEETNAYQPKDFLIIGSRK